MDAAAIQAWLDFHKRLKYPPRFINVFTAARFNDAPNILRLVRDSLPKTDIVWRGYDGKDAWGNVPDEKHPWTDSNFYLNLWNAQLMSPQMAAGMWFARRVKPYLDGIRETDAIIHLLNEATPVFNAPFETECIRLLGEEGIRAGAFAWTAGTPDWPDYRHEAIEAEMVMAAKYDALVLTHEYAGIKPEEQNSLINRNQELVTRFDNLKLPTPDVFLGEFALARAAINPDTGKVELDAHTGWRDIPVSEVQYMDFIKGTTKVWYLPNKVSFSVYSWPDWGNNGSFGVGKSQGLLDSLITASEWMSFSVEGSETLPSKPIEIPPPQPIEIPPPQPAENPHPNPPPQAGEGTNTLMPRPPEAKSGIRMVVKAIPAEYRNLRASWDYRAEKTGELKPSDVVRRFDIPLHSGLVSELSTGNWIYVEKLIDESPIAKVVQSGYVWSSRITWDVVSNATSEVPVVTTPTPTLPQNTGEEKTPNTPMTTAKCYSFQIEASDVQHELIEKALMTLLGSLVFVGQAFAGAKVTLNP